MRKAKMRSPRGSRAVYHQPSETASTVVVESPSPGVPARRSRRPRRAGHHAAAGRPAQRATTAARPLQSITALAGTAISSPSACWTRSSTTAR